MSRRILGTILALLLIAGIVALLWFWYLGRQQETPDTLNNSGNINANVPANGSNATGGTNTGTSPNRPGGANNGGVGGGNTTGANGANNGGVGGGSYGPGDGTNIVGYTSDGIPFYRLQVATGSLATTSLTTTNNGTTNRATSTPGAEWLFSGDPFNPSAINDVNDANPNGSGGILLPTANVRPAGGGGTDILGAALTVTAIGTAVCTAGLLGTVALGAAAGAGGAAAASAALAVPTFDATANVQLSTQTALEGSDTYRDNFLNCVTRTTARAALQQITASVVHWINTGFHGKPTFIQNYKKFFAGVADQAAGEFIKGSSLSFLCSPFSLKIRIALAQSYANRNAAPTCSLSSAVKNINRFMNDFSAGGWQGLIQFTTVPTNNPFGAYMYAQAGLNGSLGAATRNAQLNISPSGFLNMMKAQECDNESQEGSVKVSVSSAANGGICPSGCDCVVTTPGAVIGDTLTKQLNMGSDELNMAKNFDEIVSALMTQLLTKALYGGISNLSNSDAYSDSGLTGAQQQAATIAQGLLISMQADTGRAQQYGYIEQASIADIQGSQNRLHELTNCWGSIASSTLNTTVRATAEAGLVSARSGIATLESRIGAYNNEITQANTAIALLERLQSAVLNSGGLADVQDIKADYTQATTEGVLFSASDLTTASQNRATLQQELSATNAATANKLTQCYASVN